MTVSRSIHVALLSSIVSFFFIKLDNISLYVGNLPIYMHIDIHIYIYEYSIYIYEYSTIYRYSTIYMNIIYSLYVYI